MEVFVTMSVGIFYAMLFFRTMYMHYDGAMLLKQLCIIRVVYSATIVANTYFSNMTPLCKILSELCILTHMYSSV